MLRRDARGCHALPVVDYTGMIEAVLTKEWGGVWKFRKLLIYMDVPYTAADVHIQRTLSVRNNPAGQGNRRRLAAASSRPDRCYP